MNEEVSVPDLYRLAFMPGCFRCPQCGFGLTKKCINPNLEIMGTREQDRESEPCPNDGTMLVHVTYREQLEVYGDRLKEEFDRAEKIAAVIEAQDAYILRLRQMVYAPAVIRERAHREITDDDLAGKVTEAKAAAGIRMAGSGDAWGGEK